MREIDIDELDVLLEEGITLIDVREPQEFAQAHVPGASLIPMGQLGARLAEVPRDGTVHLICASGHRSAAVGEALDAHGFDTVNVAGGTGAWVRSGRAYDQGLD